MVPMSITKSGICSIIHFMMNRCTSDFQINIKDQSSILVGNFDKIDKLTVPVKPVILYVYYRHTELNALVGK